MLRHSGTEHHRKKTFSQAQGMETLLAEPVETGPPSAVATKLQIPKGCWDSVPRDG